LFFEINNFVSIDMVLETRIIINNAGHDRRSEHLTRAKPEHKASELLEYQNQFSNKINKERSSKQPISNLVVSGAFPFLKT